MSDTTRISVPIHDQSGKPTGGSYEFDSSELAGDVNRQLLHDVVVMYQANARQGTFKTKSRTEVSGCKKKMYKQKGTGNARAGHKRSPVRTGGGHAFAKTPRDFSYRLPKKSLRMATRMALLSKFLDKEVVVVDKIQIDQPRTKVVVGLLRALGVAETSCCLAFEGVNNTLWKSARNLPDLSVSPGQDLNAYVLLRRKHLVVTKDALDKIRERAKVSAS